MENNFLKFIEEDIETKKSLITTMPIKTKVNIAKRNDTVESMLKKYTEYLDNVSKYIDAKSKSFKLEGSNSLINTDEINNKISSLEEARFILNPFNTFLEKLKIDVLIYELEHYSDYNFQYLYEVLNSFLDVFEKIGIRLVSSDFTYTSYVYDYMRAFLEVRSNGGTNYDNVTKVFEEIYWANPELVQHIVLNFRKLIRKNAKKFDLYLSKVQKDIIAKNELKSYADCVSRIEGLYDEKWKVSHESINTIVDKALNKEFDINLYLEDSKYRELVFKGFFDDLDIYKKEEFTSLCQNLMKLKVNVEEYDSYLEFKSMVDYFKKEFSKTSDNMKKYDPKKLKMIESAIVEKENKLEKDNKKVILGKGGFSAKGEIDLKNQLSDQVFRAKELEKLYESYDLAYFMERLVKVYSATMTISDMLNLYYSFDYFKKKLIKNVFNITNGEDLDNKCLEFDKFALNSLNIITRGTLLFEDVDLARIIINKYRLNNINIVYEDLVSDVKLFIGKIDLVLRVDTINKSETNVEKIWFMVEANKLLEKKD